MTDVFRVENIFAASQGQPVLSGISFRIGQGDVFCISGKSGCGKSMLLEICSSQRKPDSGKVFWGDVDISELSQNGIMRARRQIGCKFQNAALIHNFPTFDNIALPLRYHTDMPETEVRAIVKNRMDELGLFNIDKRFPNELTTAQTQGVALARALIMSPPLLFLDEPTAGIDPFSAQGIARVLVDIVKNGDVAIVMASNDEELIKILGGKVAVLEDGKLVDIIESEVL